MKGCSGRVFFSSKPPKGHWKEKKRKERKGTDYRQ